ncbi:hypothetical protein QYE76_061163 [Lolium multiflorum]|uniref:Uncharacterized protein n=1 Tax=Lolium multiflorum TaxID=4521 RepID=A0AAD8S1Q8_LOLMU|nr:hypothetical protein QYE76_061163 [Lolium multiflorum]
MENYSLLMGAGGDEDGGGDGTVSMEKPSGALPRSGRCRNRDPVPQILASRWRRLGRWEREENEKLAKENNVAKVWTITTTSDVNDSYIAEPSTINGKIIGVGNASTPNAKPAKLQKTAKTAEIFSNIGDDDPIALDYNGLDFDDCHISEVIKFLQKLAKSPNASAINLAFTKHITNALIKAREEKLEREASIPRKLEDGWEPIIKMKVNNFDCNALCDLGASISVMPKKIYNMLDLPPLKNCYLDVNLVDNAIKKPLGRVDNVRITVNNNLVPVDFVVLDIECNASCTIILGRPFLRTAGAIIDMKEGLGKALQEFSSPTTTTPSCCWDSGDFFIYAMNPTPTSGRTIKNDGGVAGLVKNPYLGAPEFRKTFGLKDPVNDVPTDGVESFTKVMFKESR